MKIISIAHQKGGVGKTTLTLNLAAFFAKGLNVAVLDTDRQGSLKGLQSNTEGITFVSFDGQLQSLSNLPNLSFDLLIIDTPPYLTELLPDLFAISDFVLVPSKVGFLDVMAIRATLELLKQAQQQRPQLKYGVVMNMVKPRTRMNKMVQDLLIDYQVPLFETTISDRVSYSMSVIKSGIFALDDEKAIEEITALANEILNALGL